MEPSKEKKSGRIEESPSLEDRFDEQMNLDGDLDSEAGLVTEKITEVARENASEKPVKSKGIRSGSAGLSVKQ